MKINGNWRRILGKAWSVRLIALIGVLSVLEIILPSLLGVVPSGIFSTLSILTAIGAAISRVVVQPDFERRQNSREQTSDNRTSS